MISLEISALSWTLVGVSGGGIPLFQPWVCAVCLPPLTGVLNLYIMWFSVASFLPVIPHKNLDSATGQDLKITSWVGQLIIVKTLGTKSI